MRQNTPEWDAARLGKLTASKAACIMGALDTSGLKSYVMDLAWERVHGKRDEGYRNAAMDRGHIVEPQARDWYAFETGNDVRECGVIDHPTLTNVAASPDGLLDDRTVEIKSPLHKAWMDVKRTMVVPSEYRWQARWQMWCCGFSQCDFVVYHPVPGGLIIPFAVTAEECAQMEERAAVVEKMVQKWVDILRDGVQVAA